MINSIHPQAFEAFKEGLESTLRQWTALELAVLNRWGGDSSEERANEFCKGLLEMFTKSTNRIFKDDVAIYVEDFMELNFCTICEDESPEELGELLTLMWGQCVTGDFTLVTNALAREYARSEVLDKCQGIDQSGDDEMSDDDADEEAAPIDHFSSGSSNAAAHNHEGQSSSSSAVAECACMHSQGDMDLDEGQGAEPTDWHTVDKKTRKKKGGR